MGTESAGFLRVSSGCLLWLEKRASCARRMLHSTFCVSLKHAQSVKTQAAASRNPAAPSRMYRHLSAHAGILCPRQGQSPAYRFAPCPHSSPSGSRAGAPIRCCSSTSPSAAHPAQHTPRSQQPDTSPHIAFHIADAVACSDPHAIPAILRAGQELHLCAIIILAVGDRLTARFSTQIQPVRWIRIAHRRPFR